MALWMCENLTDVRFVFADTGNEHEITLEYLDYLEQAMGIKIDRVSNGTFIEACLKRKMFPSAMVRFCTRELKMEPTKKYLEQFPELTTLCVGVRRDESRSRQCAPDWDWSDFYRTDVWRPIAGGGCGAGV